MSRKGTLSLLMTLTPVLLLIGCLGIKPPNDDIPPRPSPANFPQLPAGPALEVLVIGDWGTGEAGQFEVAQAIAETHLASPPEFVLSVGDNFYPRGVSGLRDPIWQTHFEKIYGGPFWDDLVFFPVFGNHDYMGQPEAQIRYSRISSRWNMPSHSYAFQESLPGGETVLFLALDTEAITSQSPLARSQEEWADSILENTSADWVVAYGHHPIASGGRHGVDHNVEQVLFPLLEGRADLYLAGHNHSTELLDTGMGTLQAVCGGGAGVDNAYQVHSVPGTLAAFTNGGWCYLRFGPEALVVDLMDRGGGLQHRHLIRK